MSNFIYVRVCILFNRLREERTRLGFTQEQFAALGGVKMRSQINYEQGKNCPDGTYYAGIAAIGADVQYILTGTRSANALAPDEEMLLTGYRAMDARGKAGVLGLIGGMTQSPTTIGQQFNAPVKNMVGGNVTINHPTQVKRS